MPKLEVQIQYTTEAFNQTLVGHTIHVPLTLIIQLHIQQKLKLYNIITLT